MSDEKTQADPLLEFWHGQGTAVIHLSKLKPLLAQHGFYVVTEAEKRVLKTWGSATEDELRWVSTNIVNMTWLRDSALAELARRTP